MQLDLTQLSPTGERKYESVEIPQRFNGVLIIGDHPYDSFSTRPFSNSHYGLVSNACTSGKFAYNETIRTNLHDSYRSVLNPDVTANENTSALASIDSLIESSAPNVVIILGRHLNKLFKADSSADLDSERGHPFLRNNQLIIPTYHPREIFQQFHLKGVMFHDFAKAFRLGKEGWVKPVYIINYQPTLPQVIERLEFFLSEKPVLSTDIETRDRFITCVGFAWNEYEALTIPFINGEKKPYWHLHEERIIWRLVARVMNECEHLGQNAVHYDFKLLASYGIYSNFANDTMYAQWECYQELPKSLAFLTSMYTDNPYHKDMLGDARKGKIHYSKEYEYNGMDCCITYKIAGSLKKELSDRPEGSYSHYKFNIKVTKAFEYMSMRGAHFNKDLRDKKLEEIAVRCNELSLQIRSHLGYDLNVNSPKQVQDLLFSKMKLPAKYKVKERKDGSEYEAASSDNLTILYLARKFTAHSDFLLAIADLRKEYKRRSFLSKITPRKNGRIGWDFVVAGTETGRSSGKKPLDGLGVQPQNVDRRDRDLFEAGSESENLMWLKADLEGADSWTQAAQLESLNEPRLMRDLEAKMKPAQVLAIARLKGDEYMTKPVEELLPLKSLLKTKEGKLMYRICKAVSHGSAYGMKETTMHTTIFKQSDGDIYVEPSECKVSQELFYRRYNFPKLHQFMRSKMLNPSGAFLDTANGSRRYFLDRTDDALLRTMLSHAPQAHTTYVANVVIDRLYWQDKRNRRPDNGLYLEPVNQVHDETDLIFQADKLPLVRELFNSNWRVPISFWGSSFTIPFDAAYGKSWGTLDNELELK